MTRIESFEEWERETLDSFPDEKIREAFNKAMTKIEFELMVK